MEIERKFLVREPPADLARHPSDRIAQGYVALDGDDVEVRVRSRGDKATLTVKQGGGLARLEEEVPIARARFERLWPLTQGRRVEKVRHVLDQDGAVVEVDVYGGALAGLVVAEVEFDSVPASAAFEPPGWFGEEVTDDSRYRNRSLACDGLPTDALAYALTPGENVPDGLRRIARGRLDKAIGTLTAADPCAPGDAVHSARKSLKRARALVRLARDELGEDAYRRENAALRDAGRRLSGARDSQVMLETLDALLDGRDDASLSAFRGALEDEHREAQRSLSSGTVNGVLEDLRAIRARIACWRLEGDALTAGFERIHRRGRTAARAAAEDPGDEALHELRKRAKDLWYAAEILRPAAPRKTKKLARRASELSDVIGFDHDLAVLQETARRHDARSELLTRLVERRRAKLRRRALASARRLYARKPRKAARRIGLAPTPRDRVGG